MYFEPIDQIGRPVRVGDWVRVAVIPPAVAKMARETRTVFRFALGKTFRVENFNEYGLAELNLTKKIKSHNTIWVEPEYLLRFRRGRTSVS